MKLNEKQITFLKDNASGTHNSDLIRLFYEEFGVMLTRKQLKYWKHKYGLKSGFDGRFMKGQQPHNHKEIGYEFVSKNGYTYIKVAEPNTWVKKQRYLWEQENNKKVLKGQSVVFLDQDKTNFNIDNLMLIEDRDKLVMKNKHLFTTNKDLTKTGILIAKLSNKCYDKVKK